MPTRGISIHSRDSRRAKKRLEMLFNMLGGEDAGGKPRRIVLPPEVTGGAPVEYRCVDYERQGELSYPRRLERYRGVNRESVLRVQSAVACSRLAALERLQ